MSRARSLGLGLGLGLPLLTLAAGLFRVEAGEAAVVFRLGAVRSVERSGLHLRAPWPIESHARVAINEVRRIETGKQRLLTADTNLIDLQLVVQYTVADPAAFLVSADAPEDTLTALVLAEAAEAVASQEVDQLLTTGRAELERRVASRAEAGASALGLGLRIGGVEVKDLSPPPPVLDAFNDVSSARGDRETLALGAESYVGQAIPEARGAASTRASVAQARAATRVAAARGDVARFAALVEADRAQPAATRSRLWADSLRRLQAQTHLQGLPPGAELRAAEPPPAAGAARTPR